MEHHLHDPTLAHEPIPGERDVTTLTHREPGAIAVFAGAGTPPPDTHAWMDEETRRLHEIEGGATRAPTRPAPTPQDRGGRRSG